MSTTILGKVSCVGRGVYSATATYDRLDIISYNGSSYLVLKSCAGITPPNTEYYMLLAERGRDGAAGATGATGATGARGEKGDPGEPGTGLDIKGTYGSLAALRAAVTNPAQGDMYNVGTASPYTIYMWDATNGTGDWVSQGELQGAKGDAGESGATFTPAVSAAGVLSWTNDKGLTNPGSVNIKGPKGDTGDTGSKGDTGDSGPNEVTTETATDINGLLKGNGNKVSMAIPGTDYAAPDHTHTLDKLGAAAANHTHTPGDIGAAPENHTHTLDSLGAAAANHTHTPAAIGAQAAPNTATALPSSGTALTDNTIYNVSAAVGSYVFKAPASGWVHGTFTTGADVAVSFTGTFIGAAPTIEASKTYEFDVYNGVWAVQEVVSE